MRDGRQQRKMVGDDMGWQDGLDGARRARTMEEKRLRINGCWRALEVIVWLCLGVVVGGCGWQLWLVVAVGGCG